MNTAATVLDGLPTPRDSAVFQLYQTGRLNAKEAALADVLNKFFQLILIPVVGPNGLSEGI